MKKLVLFAVCLLLVVPVLSAQCKHLEEMAKHWKVSKDFTLAVADLMPAESYDFKPSPEEMTFGELMVHIGMPNTNAAAMVAGSKSPFAKPASMDKATVMKFLTDTFDYVIKTVEGLKEEQIHAMTGAPGRPQLSGNERLWSYFTHTAHHRGQAEVYLRVKGIKPPPYKF